MQRERLQLVVLHHLDFGPAHFDLMFEEAAGSALATFRLPAWPPAGEEATALAPHRRHYLTYEGEVSNGRGRVVRVFQSGFEFLLHEPGRLAMILHNSMPARLELERMEEDRWKAVLMDPGDR